MDRVEIGFAASAGGSPDCNDLLSGEQGVTGHEDAACYSGSVAAPYWAQPEPAPKPSSKGTFLDETITLRDPEAGSLTTVIRELIAPNRVLRRRQQAAEVENELQLIRCMIANGLRCRWYRDPPIVSYLRKADAYSGKRNKPKWLSGQALSRTAGYLARAGFIDLRLGEREVASGYTVTERLLSLAEREGVSEASLRRCLHREDLVQLRSEKPRPVFDRWSQTLVRQRGGRIYFEPTGETEKWRDELTRYNDFIAAQDISIALAEDVAAAWVADLNDGELHSGAPIARPELFRAALCRIFNGGSPDEPSFDLGGRLSGGWWMYAPKRVRSRIAINGEPTVELDYSACHLRMIYHERGMDTPVELYDVPEIAELETDAGLEAGYYRSGIKWLTQTMINGRGRPDLATRPDDVSLPTGAQILDLASMIRRRHEPIADSFGSGCGIRLMRTESDIALAIMTQALSEGWAVLPVHDSFLAPTGAEEGLRRLMIVEYERRFGRQPSVG